MYILWMFQFLIFVFCPESVYGLGLGEGGIGVALPFSLVLGGASAIIVGVTITISAYVMLSERYKVSVQTPKQILLLHSVLPYIPYQCDDTLPTRHTAVISRKIDAAINGIIKKFIDANVLPWYRGLVFETAPSIETLRSILWFSTEVIHERLSSVDQVNFVTGKVITGLTRHLHKIRITEMEGSLKGERGVFHLVPQMSSPVRERNFLRQVSEFLITKVLPKPYSNCLSLRTILRELIACQVLEPLIDQVCDPDWINQQLLCYLRQQQAAEELHHRTYHYAASYEDFITLIHDSTDILDLNHLRRNIINEIMQATAINNLKKAKGVDTTKESTPQGTGKGDLLQARNLKRYINQLTYAKAQCERRIAVLQNGKQQISFKGLESELQDLSLMDSEYINQSLKNLPGQKILMFQVILESAFARRYFAIYLDEIGHGSLLSFWSAVQELRLSEKKMHYQLGMEIYHTYLCPNPPPVKTDKVYLRGVKDFLLGNRGPEVLYEIAEEVERKLEDRHYTGFLVSSTYHAMLVQAHLQGVDFMTEYKDDGVFHNSEAGSTNHESVDQVTLQLMDHSTYARNKLAHLREKLTNKLLALQAMQHSPKADIKVITHLETEIDRLRSEHQQLEVHVDRTALWSSNLGHWRVFIQSVQSGEERDCPQLILLVHLDNDSDRLVEQSESSDLSSTSTFTVPQNGWVIVRKISLLNDLHRKFCQISPVKMKTMEIPTSHNKILFGKLSDKNLLARIKETSQTYFNTIMVDEHISNSEILYAFLSPSPEHLKQIGIQPKKSRFSLSTLFKANEEKSEQEDEDFSLILDGDQTSDVKDTLVEPIFSFLEELCELRGASKLLRKTLVSFVQITYGKTITRHVKESGQSLFSESMILYYLNSIKDIVWPCEDRVTENTDEKASKDNITHKISENKARLPQEILQTRYEAREQFIHNIPVIYCTLVGQQNARKGAIRLFTILQHHALNKHLFYLMLEDLLKELFPELEKTLHCE